MRSRKAFGMATLTALVSAGLRERLDDKVRLGYTKQASHFVNALPI